MATQTKTIGMLSDSAGNHATLSYDYDDVSVTLLLARVINGLAVPVFVSLTRTSDGKLYGPFTCAATQTTMQSLPASGANRLGLTLRSDGKLDGADVSFWS